MWFLLHLIAISTREMSELKPEGRVLRPVVQIEYLLTRLRLVVSMSTHGLGFDICSHAKLIGRPCILLKHGGSSCTSHMQPSICELTRDSYSRLLLSSLSCAIVVLRLLPNAIAPKMQRALSLAYREFRGDLSHSRSATKVEQVIIYLCASTRKPLSVSKYFSACMEILLTVRTGESITRTW